MAQLLLELFSEEIPARMQMQARDNLALQMTKRLDEAGFSGYATRHFATPRRITLVVDDLAVQQDDRREERKGPRVGAPDKALDGFLKSVGLTKDQLKTESDKKGEFYVAVIEQKGGATRDVLSRIVPEVIQDFHWSKSMRWGSGSLRWVRPLHSILCLFDGEVVPFEVGGIVSGDTTRGHRFMAPETFSVADFDDYAGRLLDAKVNISAENRRSQILRQASDLAEAQDFELIEDEALATETAGLVEWPVVLMGSIDANFVRPVDDGGLPPEVLTTAMAKHQKYFSVRDPKTGALAPRFILVSNLIAEDGGKQIVAGNERVLRARLSDAKFFWDQDCKKPLEDRIVDLEPIVFHAEVGNLLWKVSRVQMLAESLVKVTKADPELAVKAAGLAKADLTTEMVGEFADLQGLMGKYYAAGDGHPKALCDAIADHYSPLGPSDTCPEEPVSVTVALADKLDTLSILWAKNIRPTGSKDPYALRRAALGVIRLILENTLRLPLKDYIRQVHDNYNLEALDASVTDDLMQFFVERLKVYLRDKGAKHDLIEAVFALPEQDDLLLVVDRVYALRSFLEETDGANLLTAYKRAANILRIEEKKDGQTYSGKADPKLLQQDEEVTLHESIETVIANADVLIKHEDFVAAMAAFSKLREPVDAFFDKVTVNAAEPEIRRNRLLLLSEITATLDTVADFSKLEG